MIPSWWWSPSLSCLFLSAYIQIVLSVIFRHSKITVFLLWCGFSTSVVPDGRAFSWFDFCLETIDIRFKILIIIKFCSLRMSKLDICHTIQVFSKQVTLLGFNSQSGILVYAGEEWVLTSVASSSRCWLFTLCIYYSLLLFFFLFEHWIIFSVLPPWFSHYVSYMNNNVNSNNSYRHFFSSSELSVLIIILFLSSSGPYFVSWRFSRGFDPYG